ncbi:AraC family transcriptional regulator [Paenibacillus sp. N4]|uniref:helix-turn-helix transcriptional regulator n=1 Tax=Paenibacillus vietnamensis TaxID=2590547 RepID=UPI001CD0BAC1|nr:AraC family transcriptional regulator [Paenibacillus vietnamensis]MCA0757822.1 AraC family transcriptional regulator [Paenibacillus vietnamensis]
MFRPVSYAFRNDDRSILTLDSIGYHKIDNPAYSFSGDARPDIGHVIFQYTLSGQGYLEYEQQLFPLPKGTGFLVKVPSQHRYYFRNTEEPWEFIWLNIRGEEANRIWDHVIAQEGPIIRRELDSPLLSSFWSILRMISEEKVTDKFQLSVQVYEWMVTLVRTSNHLGGESAKPMIEKAKRFMKEHYNRPITLDLLAEHCGINKHHLCRLFQRLEHTSPLAYLRNRRVEAAITLLRTTDLPVQLIGQQCGFDSPSYFGKVFREYMAMTPKEYRTKKLEFPYDAIYYE